MIVSFYTADSLYELEAENLRLSCERFNIPYLIQDVASLGNWELNCAFKPRFILDKLQELKKDLLWVDADGEIVSELPLLKQAPGTLGICVHEQLPLTHRSKCMSNTLFFAYNEENIAFLTSWSEKCEKAPERWDQEHLTATLFEKSWPGFFNLPVTYTALYDRDVKKPHIVHYQASRLMHKIMNGEVVPFLNKDLISAEEWNLLRKEYYAEVRSQWE